MDIDATQRRAHAKFKPVRPKRRSVGAVPFVIFATMGWSLCAGVYSMEIYETAVPSVGQQGVALDAKRRVKRRCEAIDARIDWLNSRLRAGYRAAAGERWKQELRELRKEKRRRCRDLRD